MYVLKQIELAGFIQVNANSIVQMCMSLFLTLQYKIDKKQ